MIDKWLKMGWAELESHRDKFPATWQIPGGGSGNQPRRFSQSLLFVLTVTSLTGIMGQRFYNQPELGVGRIAPTTLLAPRSARVEDKESTEEKRKAARTGAIPVLKIDSGINQQIYQDLQRWLDQGYEIRTSLGPFPLISENYISLTSQLYLREVEDLLWIEIVDMVSQPQSSSPSSANPGSANILEPTPGSNSQPPTFPTSSTLEESDGVSSEVEMVGMDVPNPAAALKHQRAIEELLAYGQQRSPTEFSSLLDRFAQARKNHRATLALLADQLTEFNDFSQLVPPEGGAFHPLYNRGFLNLTDGMWQDTQVGLYTALERLLIQGIAPGTPNEIVEPAVRSQVSLTVPTLGEPLAVDLLLQVVQPNLVQDAEQTKHQAEQVAKAIEPVYVEIREGEPIVLAGEEITQPQFVLLDHFGKSKRSPNWTGLVGFGFVVLGGTTVFVVACRHLSPKMRCRDQVLILLLAISTPLLILLRLPTSTLPGVGILMGSFYGSPLGTLLVGLLGLGLPLGLEMDPYLLLPGMAGGLVATLIAGRLRSREELALLGTGVGLTHGLVYLLVSLILTAAAGQVWYILLPDAAMSGLVGVLWCIVAFGLSPYLEHVFDLVTPIRLAELSNPNRPTLKRLAAEAPGTFQHTLFVSTLAEAAARTLHCNVELVRAGTLYHDIGKMHDPQGFIENQMGGPNKHNEINDPWVSAEIIKKHVTEGLVMARKCRLPKALRAFIPEHQGTMLIAYFHHAAHLLAEHDPEQYQVQEQDFRYPGPIPQSRETGIVMLADSCEAALRSLKEASAEQALTMVTKIIRARWQDQQLVDSGLKREEMDTIAQVFVEIWQQFHHQRIPYPSSALSGR
jgi:putative nucleotidyltransferase with HDIG domain